MYVKGPTRASVAPLKYMLHLIGMISSVKYDFSSGDSNLKGEHRSLVLVNIPYLGMNMLCSNWGQLSLVIVELRRSEHKSY